MEEQLVLTLPDAQAEDPQQKGPRGLPRISFHPASPGNADRRPRSVTPEAFAATQMISNAIEYLVDSRELPSGKISELDAAHPDAMAIFLLMEARCQVYLACPVIERRKSNMPGFFKGKDRRRANPA